MTIYELKLRKRFLGLTAEQLAKAAGVPLATLQKILSGATKRPQKKTMDKLQAFFQEWEARTGSPFAVDRFRGLTDSVEYSTGPGSPLIREPRMAFAASPAAIPQGSYTVQDLEELPPHTAELIDGCLYDMAPPSIPNQITVSELAYQLEACIRSADLPCLLLTSPGVSVNGDSQTRLEPDIAVSCGENRFSPQTITAPPDLVIEVLSPSTRKKDLGLKRRKYREIGVRELWFVDTRAELVIVDRLEQEKKKDGRTSDPGPDTLFYSFDDTVPVEISGGHCAVDFTGVRKKLITAFGRPLSE